MQDLLERRLSWIIGACTLCLPVAAWSALPHRPSSPSSDPCWLLSRRFPYPAHHSRIRTDHYLQATRSEVEDSSPELDDALELNGLRPSTTPTTNDGDFLLSQEQEYWLDLRGISISPTEALQFLSILLEDSDSPRNGMEDLVDRVLVDQSVSADGLETIDGIATLTFDKEAHRGVPSIYHDACRKTLFSSVISAEPTRNLDILLAMDAVITRRGWVLVDTDSACLTESVEWLSKQVSDLYELLATSHTGLSDSPGGLILPASAVDRGTAGGIAISVPTRSALLDVDFALTQAALLTRRAGPGRANDGAVLRPIDATAGPDLQTALVVPFDLDMWRLLLNLKGA